MNERHHLVKVVYNEVWYKVLNKIWDDIWGKEFGERSSKVYNAIFMQPQITEEVGLWLEEETR